MQKIVNAINKQLKPNCELLFDFNKATRQYDIHVENLKNKSIVATLAFNVNANILERVLKTIYGSMLVQEYVLLKRKKR